MKINCCHIALWMLLLIGTSGLAAPGNPALHTFSPDSFQTQGPNIIRVPFTLTGGLITIRARVDTVEGNFFFDTGASKLLLNQRYFSQNRPRSDAARGVTGDVAVLGSIKIDTLQFDNFLKTKISADLVDFSHLENGKKLALVGLIGAGVFEAYEILFDYEASLIVMVRLDNSGTPIEALPEWEYGARGSVPLRVSEHIAMVYLPCGAKGGVWMGLDSGAEQNLLSHNTPNKFLKANFEIRHRIKLKGAGQESLEVLSGMLNNAHLDTFQFKPMATLLTRMGAINAAYAAQLDGILGYEFLSQRLMSVNMRRRKLTFYVRITP